MREIKFRAWDKSLREMWDWKRIHNEVEGFPSIESIVTFFDAGRWTVEQFTGLKDGDGTEVYEGDIVRTDSGTVGIIIYYLGQYDKPHSGYGCIASFEIDESRDGKTSMRSINRLVRVIGNIHENPDLLAGH